MTTKCRPQSNLGENLVAIPGQSQGNHKITTTIEQSWGNFLATVGQERLKVIPLVKVSLYTFFLNRPNDGNDVQIGAGKFIHYYAPDKLPTMAKHVIFVIDISGSMRNKKLDQTKDALLTILKEMKEKNIGKPYMIFFQLIYNLNSTPTSMILKKWVTMV